MADDGGFEAYSFHVPQQSRRDKLRDFMAQNHPNPHLHNHPLAPPQHQPFLHHLHGCSGLFPPPLYDHHPSSLYPYINSSGDMRPHSSSPMDGLGSMITAPPSSTSSSSSSPSPSYLDSSSQGVVVQVPPSYLVNPSSLPANSHSNNNNNNNPFLYSSTPHQNLGQGSSSSLSLSLSSHYSNSSNPAHYHHSQANGLPLELDLRRYGGGPAVNYEEKTVTWSGEYVVVNPSGSTSYEASRSPVPLGPFTGYASILRGSKFLKPAQELLEQLLSDGCGREEDEDHHQEGSLDVSVMDPPNGHCLVGGVGLEDDPFNGGRKSKLISILEEVYKRYRQLYQQIQAVAASFDCVAGLGNATPYANLALKALSKHFKAVKMAITDQLQSVNKSHGQVSHMKDESAKAGHADRGPCGQKSMNSSGFIEQRPVWRPQRGLPERAVAVLRTWLFDHFLHPYPTDTDKIMLANQTGLSRNQVSNWFINARVRLWKPMVEEIHMLESRQPPMDSQIDELNANRPREQTQLSNPFTPSHPSARKRGIQDVPPPKCSATEHPDLPVGGGDQLNYNDMPSQSHAGVVSSSAINSGRVSLTLGLHQNNALSSSEPYPVAAARRIGLGLDANSQGFVMGSFESHNRQFGRDVIGGQLFG